MRFATAWICITDGLPSRSGVGPHRSGPPNPARACRRRHAASSLARRGGGWHRQPGTTHQPCYALAAMPFAPGPEFGMHPWRIVGLTRGCVHGPDPPPQRGIRRGVSQRGTAKPGVVADAQDAEQAAIRAIGKAAWFALTNRKTQAGSSRSRGRTRPQLERECRAPGTAACSRAATGRVPCARPQSGRPRRGGLRLAPALLPVSGGDPVPDRLGRGLELAGEVGRVASGTDQFDHLTPELRRIRWMGLGHRRTPHAKASSVSTEPG